LIPVAVALVVLGGSWAQAQTKVYTWTDSRGNVYLTDTAPPDQGRVLDVIESPTGASPPDAPPRPQRSNREFTRRAETEAAAQRAREAEQEAQAAVARADEQSRYAIEYRKRYSNSSERRENFKYKIRAEEEKAEALRLEALKAIDRARAASEEARSAAPAPPGVKP
jgi:hypothetical protein